MIFRYFGQPDMLMLMLATRLIIIFAIFPLHEYAHARAALKAGDNTAYSVGRVTLNPFAHIDPIGAILLIVFGIGWAKPTPINPRNFRNYRRDTGLVAAAGPLANLLCAAAVVFIENIVKSLVYYAGVPYTPAISYLLLGLSMFAQLNVLLTVFNLLPIGGFDGSKILYAIFGYKVSMFLDKYSEYLYWGMLLLFLLGILDGPMSWLVSKLLYCLDFLFMWVGLLFRLIFH